MLSEGLATIADSASMVGKLGGIDAICDVVRKVYKEHSKAHLTSFLLVPVPELADHVGMPFRWLLRGYTAWCVITTTKVRILDGQQLSSTHTAPTTCERLEGC
jgi:hypothetical protein